MPDFDPAELARLAAAAKDWSQIPGIYTAIHKRDRYIATHRDAIVAAVTAAEEGDYWMGQFVKVMRALGLESDPWHSDDVIDMAADFVPQDDLQAAVTRAEEAETKRDEWADTTRMVMRAHNRLLADVWSAAEVDTDIDDLDYVLEVIQGHIRKRKEAEAARIAFTSRLGFGDNVTEPAAQLADIVDSVEQALHDGREHAECPSVCNGCGEWLADTVCEHCNGSGAHNAMSEAALAHVECEWCAGDRKVHKGCVEKSYTELADALGRVEALHQHEESAVNPDTGVCAECPQPWPCDTHIALRGGA